MLRHRGAIIGCIAATVYRRPERVQEISSLDKASLTEA
jgi:hypothetical protein